MHNIQPISQDLIYIGASDRRISLFENIYPVPRGVSYNSYLLLDQKTALLDTADASVADTFLDNLDAALQNRQLDYLIANHIEPDHSALLAHILLRHPETKIVATAKAAQMITQFFNIDPSERIIPVKDGDTLCTGLHTLSFFTAPMVHWPEVMVTYDNSLRTLFSADAFGAFGALAGNIFADHLNFEHEWLGDARRYFVNIVGKYGPQVQALLKKAASLDIDMICPLHGPIWRQNLQWIIDKHNTWSLYQPEERTPVIIYGSIYGHTETAALRLATLLAQRGIRNIKAYDASRTHTSKLLSECFRASHIVLAAATYNNGIFTPIEELLLDLKAHNFQNRTWALIENGSWAPQSGKLMRAIIEQMPQSTILPETLSIKSALKDPQEETLVALADAITLSLNQ